MAIMLQGGVAGGEDYFVHQNNLCSEFKENYPNAKLNIKDAMR